MSVKGQKGSSVYRVFASLDQMTFEGQKNSLSKFRWLFFTVAALSFALSQWLDRFSICIVSTLATTLLSLLLFAPAWDRWKIAPLRFVPDLNALRRRRNSVSEEAERLITNSWQSKKERPN